MRGRPVPNYDFQSLSSIDFEDLVRDLLQAESGVRYEVFGPGRDNGIDLRAISTVRHRTIVQCKHYADFGRLYRTIKQSEMAKIAALSPDRYILATSVSLTPARKTKLLDLLSSFSREEDILGRADLNNLLSRHPEVETKNFKLWLTSEPVLRRLIAGGVIEDTSLALERMRQRTRRFVINPSLDRARQILAQHHFCVIAGIPGIGKSTLAEILLLDLVDRHGFQAVRIVSSLATELRGARRPQQKQVFIFDDFLGKTTLDKLDKNEDQQLAEFIAEVKSKPEWRFILTTREYILNVAMQRYESLSTTELRLCVIDLADYTRPIRAEILYNHIYFSDLTLSHKRALLVDRNYTKILEHQNYNPRVIEHMTQESNVTHVPPSSFLAEFLRSLSNPMKIWDHAFRFQLSEPARHLMLLMGALPYEIMLSDLEWSFQPFLLRRKQRFGFQTASGDFANAMRELDGNFIKTAKYGKDWFVTFHNPSVQDYVRRYIRDDPSRDIIFDLLASSIFVEQITEAWRVVKDLHDARVTNAFLSALANIQSLLSCRMIRTRSGETHLWLSHDSPSFERRVSFIIEVADAIRSARSTEILEAALMPLTERLEQRTMNRRDLARLVGKFSGFGPLGSTLVDKAQRALLQDLETTDDYEAAATFLRQCPGSISTEELDALKLRYRAFVVEEANAWEYESDSDILNSVIDDLSSIARALEMNIESDIESLTDRSVYLEQEKEEEKRRESDRDEFDYDYREYRVIQSREDAMFASLLYELTQAEEDSRKSSAAGKGQA
jgi:hypothetical protein